MRLIVLLILLCIYNSTTKKLKLSNYVDHYSKNHVFNFGPPRAGKEIVYSKEGSIRDRRVTTLTIDPPICYEIKFVQVNVTVTSTPPTVALQEAGRKYSLSFTYFYTKPGGQRFEYNVIAKADKKAGCEGAFDEISKRLKKLIGGSSEVDFYAIFNNTASDTGDLYYLSYEYNYDDSDFDNTLQEYDTGNKN